jgi:hypothetical protein
MTKPTINSVVCVRMSLRMSKLSTVQFAFGWTPKPNVGRPDFGPPDGAKFLGNRARAGESAAADGGDKLPGARGDACRELTGKAPA